MNHPTSVPKQAQTDTWAVFQVTGGPNIELLTRIEVPRYSRPDGNGIELSRGKRLQLAVQRAVESDQSNPDAPFGISELAGETFYVMTDMDAELEAVNYQMNPTETAVWYPEDGA